MRLVKIVLVATGLGLAIQLAEAKEVKDSCGVFLVLNGQNMLLLKGDPMPRGCWDPTTSTTPITRKVAPMELQTGDRLLAGDRILGHIDYRPRGDRTIEWEVVNPPYMKGGDSTLVRALLQRVGHPEATATLFAGANENLSIYRSSEKE